MKSILLTFAFLVFSSIVFATHKDNPKPYITKNFGSSTIKSVNVRTSGGSITVVGGSEATRVEVYVRGNNWSGSDLDKEEIEERLKDYVLTLKQDGDALVCEAKRKETEGFWDNWKNGISISFKVFVPEKITSNLRTSGGSISLKNVSGTQDFATSGGSINVQDVDGNIKGRTSGGSIHASACKGAKIDLSTSGGSIKANNCDGEVRLTTSGGSISLDNMKGNLYASTSGGSINAEIIPNGKPMSLLTSGGSIHAKMPLTGAFNLDLRGNRVSVGALSNFDGKIEKNHVQGSLNGGGALVTMRTSGGSVTVN